MKWRIADIRKFYLFVSRELRSTSNEGNRESVSPSTRPTSSGDDDAEIAIRQLLRAAISWMQVLVEEETRLVVSRSRSGLLIADRLAKDFFPQDERTPHDGVAASSLTQTSADKPWGGAAEGLASAIHNTVAARLDTYGIAVDDVSLQEIKLPPAVIEECIRACKAYYIPISAQRESAEIGAKLEAQVNVLGREAVAAKEVVGSAPAFAVADFLTTFLQKQLRHGDKGGGNALDGIAASMGALPGQATDPSSAPRAITPQEFPK